MSKFEQVFEIFNQSKSKSSTTNAIEFIN